MTSSSSLYGTVTTQNTSSGNSTSLYGEAGTPIPDSSGNVVVRGDLYVLSGNILTTATTGNIFPTNATTVNLGLAATAVNIGAGTGTTTINNDLQVNGTFIAPSADFGNITIAVADDQTITTTAGELRLGSTTGDIKLTGVDAVYTDTTGTFNLLNQPTTINAFRNATTLEIGEDTGTTGINNNLRIDGTSINLAQSTDILYSEAGNRLNRPTVQSTTGNSSGFRIVAPNTGTTALSTLSVGNSSDSLNTEFLSMQARGSGLTDTFRIFTGEYIAGVLGASGKSVAFTDNTNTYATVNPAGPTIGTDLTTVDYVAGVVAGGVTSITGTANQVIVSSPTGAVTLSLPQDINTGANPEFAGATLGNIKVGLTDNNTIDTSTGGLKLGSVTGQVGLIGAGTLYTDQASFLLFNSPTSVTAFDSATTLTMGDTTGTTSIRNDVTVGGDLQVNGNNVDLAQATVIGYSEANNRANRPAVQSTTGNSSGFRVLAPNATTSAQSNLTVFGSNDINNGEFMSIQASGSTTAPFSVRTGKYTGGTLGASGEEINFIDNATTYASINPAGPTNGTDLTTKTYVDGAIVAATPTKLVNGIYEFTLNADGSVTTPSKISAPGPLTLQGGALDPTTVVVDDVSLVATFDETLPGGDSAVLTATNGSLTWAHTAGAMVIGSEDGTWSLNPDGSTSFPNYNFPYLDGTTDQVLKTDGSGNQSWVDGEVVLGTTAVPLGSTQLTLAGLTSVEVTQDPTTNLQLATKQYVDNTAATGLTFHDPVYVATVVDVTNVAYNQPGGAGVGVGATLTRTSSFATLQIDGVVVPLNARVLVRLQSDQTQNGVYTVTNTGSPSTGWVLTRATDADTYGSNPDQLSLNDYFFVQNGSTQANIAYVLNAPAGTITFGTSNITFAEFSRSTTYTGSTPIDVTGTVISLSTVPVTLGGTGQTTANAALNALLPTQTANTGKYLTTDGVDTSWATLPVDPNTTYTIDASAATGGANLNLVGSDASTDTIKFASGTGITVAQTDANTITVNSTITQYTDADARAALSAGTGISYNSGTGVITNSGVTALAGSNHISVDASTGSITVTSDATNANTPSTIVARDSNGDFSAGTITANLTNGDRVLGALTATPSTTYVFAPPVVNNITDNNGLDAASSYLTALGNGAQQQLTHYFADTFAGFNTTGALNLRTANGNSETTGTIPWTGVAPTAASATLSGNTLGSINYAGYATTGFASAIASQYQGGNKNANHNLQIQGITTETLADGTLTISGATITAVSRVSAALASVAVTGTRGQISFTATTPAVGNAIVVTGTNTGTSTGISAGTYFVTFTGSTSTATLSATPNGAPITTTAGTTTGLTFTRQFITVTYSAQTYIPFGLNALVTISGFNNVTSGTYAVQGTSTTTSVIIGAPSSGVPTLSGSQSVSCPTVTNGGAALRVRAMPAAKPMNSGNRVEIINHSPETATYKSDQYNFQGGSNAFNYLTANAAAVTAQGSLVVKDLGGTTTYLTVDAVKAAFTRPVGLAVYTAAALTAITGAVGYTAAVSNSPTVGGRLAFWDTTNARWSYVSDNTAV